MQAPTVWLAPGKASNQNAGSGVPIPPRSLYGARQPRVRVENGVRCHRGPPGLNARWWPPQKGHGWDWCGSQFTRLRVKGTE
jgi:hypothetical protein